MAPADPIIMSNESYTEPACDTNMEFTEKSIRMGFIRKVYMILMAQLVVTFGFVAVFTMSEDLQLFTQQNPAMFWVAFVGMFICLIALSCCGEIRRRTPHNFIFLGIFTVCEGFLLGCASGTYKAEEVMMAVGICAAVCLGLTLFALQTKYDFTICSGFLFVFLIVLILFGILAMIFPSKTLGLVYSSLGAVLFCFYLVVDTQMMLGGTHKYTFSAEEYVFASLTLYLDVINIFIYILSIIGLSRN